MKTQGNLVAEIGGRITRIEVAGGICLRMPRTIQGCRVDDDDDVDDDWSDNWARYYFKKMQRDYFTEASRNVFI